MAYDIYAISSYAPRPCGIAAFTSNVIGALKHTFTGEISSIEVYAIDDSKGMRRYDPLVELVIDQFDPKSWVRTSGHIITRASERQNNPIIMLQHEFGLDGERATGTNYLNLARILKTAGIPIFTYLHTVSREPNEHQKTVTQKLAETSERLIVTTQSAIKILEDSYGIPNSKIKHIDHGIRMHNRSKYSRKEIKKKYGLEDMLIISTLGLKSINKGLEFGIEAYGKFINELEKENREKTVYLIAGEYHPGFISQEEGKYYKEHLAVLEDTLKKSGLNWAETSHLDDLKNIVRNKDVAFLNNFLEEENLLDLYGATDIILLPYRNPEQISSGILADAVGSGRIAISTKFLYAVELLAPNPEKAARRGIVINHREGRGILIDFVGGKDQYGLYTPSVEQLTKGLKYLASHEKERFQMEERAFERGHRMNWQNVAGDFIQLVKFHENLKVY